MTAEPQPGAGAEQGAAGADPLWIAEWLAKHHRRPFTEAATRARLPAGADLRRPEALAMALAASGLKSRLVLRRLRRLDAAVLPAVLFSRDGVPLLLTDLSADRRTARIVEPDAAGMEREVPVRVLARQLTGEVLLVTVEDDLAERRLEEAPEKSRGHWFWRPVLQNWPSLLQVVVAALAVNLLGLALPLFVMNVYDRVIPNLAYVTLWTLAIGVGIAIALDLLLRSLRAGILERVGRRLDTAIASSLFAHAMNVRAADRPGGSSSVISHIRDFEAVREFFASSSFVAIIDLFFIGIFLWVLWLIVGPLALVPLAAVPVVLLIALIAQLTVGRALTQAQSLAGRRHAVLVETLGALETVKSVGAEPVLQREWDRANAASVRVSGRARFWAQFATNSSQIVLQAVSVGIIVWGVFLIAEGRITIGALIAANILASRALAPLSVIAQTVFRAQYASRSLAMLSTFMAIPPERAAAAQSALQVRDCALAFDQVTVRYPGAEMPALAEVDLAIAPGETVALLGRVGSGKSTLGKVMAGLVVHESGTVLIDGRGLNQYDPAELRAAVGYLPQEPELFTGTLRENLLIGRPGAPEEEMERALRLSGMDRFVAELPDGLDLFLGEKGESLSGGQRQGLALARLLIRRPKLLFLDEPTSAMDREMEAMVAERLTEVAAEGVGIILCTHRPSLAQRAQRVIVLERGRKLLDGPREVVFARLGGNAAEPRVAE